MFRISVLCLALSCAAAIAHAEVNIQRYEAPGNLKPTQNRGCIPLSKADVSLSPADLALSVQACAKNGKASDAAQLLGLMVARGRFDTMRVTDKSAYQAVDVLMMGVMQSLSTGQRGKVMAEFDGLIVRQQPPGFQRYCAALAGLGAPAHDPTYMIAHGIKAFTGRTEAPLRQPFNAGKAWNDVLRDYMKCPV